MGLLCLLIVLSDGSTVSRQAAVCYRVSRGLMSVIGGLKSAIIDVICLVKLCI